MKFFITGVWKKRVKAFTPTNTIPTIKEGYLFKRRALIQTGKREKVILQTT